MGWRNFYLCFSTVISALGLAGCIWVIVTEYLDYDVVFTHQLANHQLNHLKSAQLDICYPQSNKLSTVGEVWSQTSEPFEGVKLKHLNPHFDSHVFKFTHGRMACYSIGFQADYYGPPTDLPWDPIFEAEIHSNDTKSDQMKIYLHDSTIEDQWTQEIALPRMYSGERKNLHVVLSYSLITKRLLPPPFTTKCRHYQKSRSVCQAECLNKEIKGFYGNGYRAAKTMAQYRSHEILKEDAPWHKSRPNCLKSTCGQADCFQKIFIPKIQSVVPSLVDKVVLVPEITPVTQQVVEAKVPLRKTVVEIFEQIFYWMAASPIPFLIIESTVDRLVGQRTSNSNNNKGLTKK